MYIEREQRGVGAYARLQEGAREQRAADAEAASNATYAEMPEIVVQSGGGRKKKAKAAGGGGGAAQQKGLFRKKNDTKRQKATSAR